MEKKESSVLTWHFRWEAKNHELQTHFIFLKADFSLAHPPLENLSEKFKEEKEKQLHFLWQVCSFPSLEHALPALAKLLLLPPLDSEEAQSWSPYQITLTATEQTPSGETFAAHYSHANTHFEIEQTGFGHADIIFEENGVGIYRLRIAPQSCIPTHFHREMEEYELVLSPHLRLQGKPVQVGDAFAWPKSFPHRYDNFTNTEQAVLCVDKPRFLRHDEVEVDCSIDSLVAPPFPLRSEKPKG